MKSIRYKIIKFLWHFKRIWRHYCWADAVMWAEWGGPVDITRAKHDCFWCMACNTQGEIEAYEANARAGMEAQE